MQRSTKRASEAALRNTAGQPASHETDTAPKPVRAPDPRQLVGRHRDIGIAAVAAAVRYQSTR